MRAWLLVRLGETSVGQVADDYDRVRPGPPDEALDWLVPRNCQVAIDIAAGTGLFTRALRRRVAGVIAVEPDEWMRVAGRPARRADLWQLSRFPWADGGPPLRARHRSRAGKQRLTGSGRAVRVQCGIEP